MNKQRKYFTSESVTEGHPDKIADQISDAILDAHLEQDPDARVAVETLLTTGQVHIAGEVRSTAIVDYAEIARRVIRRIGYISSEIGFDADTCGINVAIGAQSPDIAQGVDRGNEEDQGAGDQGIMFGYATMETPHMMPAAIEIAHRLAAQLTMVRISGDWGLLPDGKTQVTLVYEDGYPVAIDTIVVSTQHESDMHQDEIEEIVMEQVVKPVIANYNLDTTDLKVLINPTGRFVIGGPMGDAGLTGRKIIVDTYGGAAPHGGGAFSGKDPSKVDRSGAYAARWIAKTVVASGLADKCQIQIAYAIGVAEPVGLYVDTYGTGAISDERIANAIRKTFDLRPAAITKALGLKKVKYETLAAYGHMGRGKTTAPWESTSRAAILIGNCE